MIQITDSERNIGKKVTFHFIQEDILNMLEDAIDRYPDNDSVKEAYNKIVDIDSINDFEDIYTEISNSYDNPYWSRDRMYYNLFHGHLSRILGIDV